MTTRHRSRHLHPQPCSPTNLPAAPGAAQAAGMSIIFGSGAPFCASAPEIKSDALLRQGTVKRRALPLSYGPPDLGPAGLEPATTSLEGCSSTCIRSKASQTKSATREARHSHTGFPAEDCASGACGLRPVAVATSKSTSRLDRTPGVPDVVLPAFAQNRSPRVATNRR